MCLLCLYSAVLICCMRLGYVHTIPVWQVSTQYLPIHTQGTRCFSLCPSAGWGQMSECRRRIFFLPFFAVVFPTWIKKVLDLTVEGKTKWNCKCLGSDMGQFGPVTIFSRDIDFWKRTKTRRLEKRDKIMLRNWTWMRAGKNEAVEVKRCWKSWRKITNPGMTLFSNTVVETCDSCDSDISECKGTSLAGEREWHYDVRWCHFWNPAFFF